MAKVVRHLRERQNEFQKVFSGLYDARSSWQAWADFVELSAIEISNSFDREGEIREEREARYIQIMKTYHEPERRAIGELFSIMAHAIEEDQEQDFLGEMFMALELGNHWKGQFFTPYSVCRMMAEMMIGGAEKTVENRGWVGVNDPACGAGALMIAARNEFKRKGIGYRDALFVCQDIDRIAGMMCYIQLSLIGCAGYVVIADTLCNPLIGIGESPLLPIQKPDQEFWFTPYFYDTVWQERIKWRYAASVIGMAAKMPTAAVATPAVCEMKPAGDQVQMKSRTEQTQNEAFTVTNEGQLSLF